MKQAYIIFILFIVLITFLLFAFIIREDKKRIDQMFPINMRDIENTYKFVDIEIPRNNLKKDRKVLLNNTFSGIFPRRIFQTGVADYVTKNMGKAAASWNLLNSHYNYRYFNNDDCERFLAEYFPGKVLDAYHKIIPGAFKADLFRYCLLYKYGGVYCDNKMICLKPIDDYLKNYENVDFVVAIDYPTSKKYLYNAFMISRPNHPFLRKAINQICENVDKLKVNQRSTIANFLTQVKNYFSGAGVPCLELTGPGLLGKVVAEELSFHEKQPDFTEGIRDYKDGKVLFLRHDFSLLKNRGYIKVGKDKVIQTFYPSYYRESKLIYGQPHYSKSFQKGNILEDK